MKARTRKFAVDIIRFCDSINNNKASSVITYQLVKSATSTGANYRAALSNYSEELERLIIESIEINKIMSKAKSSTYNSINN